MPESLLSIFGLGSRRAGEAVNVAVSQASGKVSGIDKGKIGKISARLR